MGWSSGWPPESWSSNTGDPQSFTRALRELSERSLSGEPASGAPGSKAGQETPAGAFVFPSTTGLRKLLAGSQGCQRAASAKEAALSDGGSAGARVPCVPRHRPREECPGGGWGAELDTPGCQPSLPAPRPTKQAQPPAVDAGVAQPPGSPGSEPQLCAQSTAYLGEKLGSPASPPETLT